MRSRGAPIGVVLAGGSGRRIGGDKAIVELAGQPLIKYPLLALSACTRDVAIIAKADTVLPDMPGVHVWIEPSEPQHPLAGIAEALALAAGRPILVAAADMPFIPPGLLRRLLETDAQGAAAVVPVCDGRLQPFPGLYMPSAARALAAEAKRGTARLVEVVAALAPVTVDFPDPEAFFSVNAPEDLLHAAAMLDRQAKRISRM